MNNILIAIYSLALIPLIVWVYGNCSALVQLIFNKNYNEPALKNKYQLNSYASYFLVAVGFLNFFNSVLLHNNTIDIGINYGIVLGSYWYLVMLIKHQIQLKSA